MELVRFLIASGVQASAYRNTGLLFPVVLEAAKRRHTPVIEAILDARLAVADSSLLASGPLRSAPPQHKFLAGAVLELPCATTAQAPLQGACKQQGTDFWYVRNLTHLVWYVMG